MRRIALLATVALAAHASVASLAPVSLPKAVPPDAAQAVADARAQARKDGKNVLVVFHASWCGWCKRFDRMLEDPKLKPVFDRSYVVVHLDVLENGEGKALENPGGEKVMAALGGKGAGLPFYAVVDPGGKKIGDSLQKRDRPATNVGFPAQPDEIAYFMGLLRKTAPKAGGADRDAVATYLKAEGKE